jgi:hypothetical protein
MLRETIQVSDDVQVYDLMLLIGESAKVALGAPAHLTVVSPWIDNVRYYLGSSGLNVVLPRVTFAKSDVIELLQIIRFLLTHPNSIVRIATLEPSYEKYPDLTFQIWELRFLLEASEAGAKIFFYKPKGEKKILHPKLLITSLGVVFGSFNLTKAGRYYHIEDGNYSSSSSPVYFEKKQRAEEILNKCQEVNTVKIRKLLEEFETRLAHSQT